MNCDNGVLLNLFPLMSIYDAETQFGDVVDKTLNEYENAELFVNIEMLWPYFWEDSID